MFREFGDLEGTLEHAKAAVSESPISPHTYTRNDSFMRRGKAVHRIYFVNLDDYATFFTSRIDSFKVR